jgi:uncharacterized membrane protein
MKEQWFLNTARARKACQLFAVIVALMALLHPTAGYAASNIAFVQSAYSDPQSPQTLVSVTYTGTQTSGNLNVVVVGWNDTTANVVSVTDSKGNLYTRALGPTSVSGYVTQSVYYAKNIAGAAAGTNAVTVTFSPAAVYPDVRILEYNGADPNNLVDVTAAGSGYTNSASSGSATTTNANDLIFGADTVTTTSGIGTGFTKRILASPDADLVEDKTVTTTVSYSATAPWVMQMIAFRPGSSFSISASPSSLTIAQGNQGTSTITTTIHGNFRSSIGLSSSGAPSGTTVSFNPTTIPAPGNGTSTMTITVGTNTALGTYPITVTGNGGGVQQTTTVTLTVTAPGSFSISASPSSLTVAQGNQGTSTITTAISGSFNSSISLSSSGAPSGATVTFNPTTIPAPGNGSSTMTINVGASTPAGMYPITVTGNGGGIQHNTSVTLTVTATASFTISASPSSLTVAQGNQGISTITTMISSGFNSSIALSATGAPSGAVVSFNPTTIPAPGSGTSTMTITVGSTTPTGTYPITVTGNGGGVQQNTTVTLTVTAASTTISYVQGNYVTPQSSVATVNVPYVAAQFAGDLNVVVVGWNDSTATVASVTDTKGNVYSPAVGPTVVSGTLSQSIYYAKNIVGAAAGTNTVTVTFTSAAAYPDVRVLEYSGADQNSPVDVIAANSGTGTLSNSGSVTTTNPFDLIFGANIVTSYTSGPGTGFRSRLLTSPDGDIAEDAMVTTTGSYSATAPLTSGTWIMQMVAFRASTSGGPLLTSITVTPINPTILVGAQQQFTATGNYSDGSHQNLTNSADWTSSLTSVATINSSGLATGVAPGSTTIQAAVGTINGSTTLTVTAAFTVSPRGAVVTFTQTQQFTATQGFGSVTWLVDSVVGGSPATGTITQNGLYTPPQTVGSHVITGMTSQQSANATVYVSNYAGTFTYHNDNMRTGQNTGETVLTTSNVNHNQFGKLFAYPLDGIAFASPLYVESVNIGGAYHNVVYVATEHDSVYAFDADGLSNNPLWHVSFLSNGVTPIPACDTGECTDIPTEIGITGTPVIDKTTGTMYLVAATKENGSHYYQRLHALDIKTGAEKFGGPVIISGSVPGSGDGSSGGSVPFSALYEGQRPGLLLNNGVVYIGFGSHGDNHPWHGWVIGYNAGTLQQAMIYNVSPNGYGGGIWQGGGGLATDATSDIYFSTGNGTFDLDTGGNDYGDSAQKISPSGSVVDYFTPHDQNNMNVNDLDLGSGGPVLLLDQPGPYPHELITAGKSGTLYVVNRDNMGHYNPNNDNQIIQSLPGVLPNGNGQIGNFSTPVYFNGYVYFGAVNDYLKAFRVTNGLLSTSPTSQSAVIYPVRGASFAISANGTSNGILWALQNNGQSPDNDTGAPGILYAYDATNLANELYDTSQAGTRDTLDLAAKFSVPLVANGKVFVAGQSKLTVLGLLP